jgi:Arc/MetJ-type ribon-helix-helix transcriptional regulator
MIDYHTMAKAKVAVTIDSRILGDLDALIAAERFPNRSQAIEAALADKINRLKHTRLAREVAKLDPRQEQAEADEGLAMDAATWPEY